MKRFYTLVSHQKETDGGYSIRLDGKPVKAPSGAMLSVPSEALADAIVQEWANQEEGINPETMPLTQISNTAQDKVSVEREAMSEQVLRYLDTDLLCYRASAEHDEQKAVQEELWDPHLKWFETKFGVALETTSALAALKQPQEAHEKMREYVSHLDDQHFTILQVIVPLAGSLVLGMAFVEGAASAQDIYKATHAEEDFKAEIYNEALHGRAPLEEKKDAAMQRDLEAAAIYLKGLKT